MKYRCFLLLCLCGILAGCGKREKAENIYRLYAGKVKGYDLWIVDGYKVRQKVYKEFLYGGNEQRYLFVPRGEIWIDHAISCEEYEMTLVHELNERHLMAKFGWSYERSHDSSLAIELVLRQKYEQICKGHEAGIKKVSPTDHTNKKEISFLPDSIRIESIYRIPMGHREGCSVWIVDGYRVRKNIFPDFGFSGNDLSCHFIPSHEIWIDGQVSCEETEYAIREELQIRRLMNAGMEYSDAYETAMTENHRLRDLMTKRIRSHAALAIPDPPERDSGIADPAEP